MKFKIFNYLVIFLGLINFENLALANNGLVTLKVLGLQDTSESNAYALNNKNQVVGIAIFPNGAALARWDNTDFTTVFKTQQELAWNSIGINDKGEVVGSYASGTSFKWANDSTINYMPPNGYKSISAKLINNNGVISGELRSATNEINPYAPVVVDNGKIKKIGKNSWFLTVNGMNNSNVVVGGSYTDMPAFQFGATLWRDEQTKYLPFFSTWNTSEARDINDHNQIVGMFHRAGEEFNSPAFWHDNHAVELPLLEGFRFGRANAINNSGVIVGILSQGSDTKDKSRAVLWKGGKIIDLNEYLDERTKAYGWVLTDAVDINEYGVIAGRAYNVFSGRSFAYMLSGGVEPVPEPSTYILILIGILLLSYRKRIKNCAGSQGQF